MNIGEEKEIRIAQGHGRVTVAIGSGENDNRCLHGVDQLLCDAALAAPSGVRTLGR